MVTQTQEKVRENRLRRAADRQRLRIVKSRRRDPRAVDYGKFWVYKTDDELIFGGNTGATVSELEAFLDGDQS